MKVAAAQYPIERIASEQAWSAKIARMTAEAVAAGARLLVFPEYACVELTALVPDGDVVAQLHAMQRYHPLYHEVHREAARAYGVTIVGGSFPQRLDDGRFRNRAYVFGPNGAVGMQEKLHMTRWEDEAWRIEAGSGVGVFEVDDCVFGVQVCLDAEFPAQGRRQAEAGATLLVVPSCTDTLHGWHRVRTGCLARALENQCFVVMASTVGVAEWSEAIDVSVGAAGVYAPMDEGLPPDGVIAAGKMDVPGWVYADLDFARLHAVREGGSVQTFRKGGDHIAILQGGVERTRL